ncbi:hypothetical protein [Streptacidiphilus sp. MAP5-3]|uniref:hypothetical protein n=1 Tax=unclassified Streptacidiphilus TaxID=2643834 RepID=UPI0035139F42
MERVVERSLKLLGCFGETDTQLGELLQQVNGLIGLRDLVLFDEGFELRAKPLSLVVQSLVAGLDALAEPSGQPGVVVLVVRCGQLTHEGALALLVVRDRCAETIFALRLPRYRRLCAFAEGLLQQSLAVGSEDALGEEVVDQRVECACPDPYGFRVTLVPGRACVRILLRLAGVVGPPLGELAVHPSPAQFAEEVGAQQIGAR